MPLALQYRSLRFPLLAFTLVSFGYLAGCSQSEDVVEPVLMERLNIDGTPYKGSGNFAQDPWGCVRDPRTELVWEVKTADSGLRSKEHTYSWYEPDIDGNRGEPGDPNLGSCSAINCDTRSYTEALRNRKLCGFDDWRVPGHAEIGSINDLRFLKSPPTIDPAYFPNTLASAYWTISTYGFYPESAWSWQFDFGHDRVDWKKAAKHLRLVRGKVIHKLKKK